MISANLLLKASSFTLQVVKMARQFAIAERVFIVNTFTTCRSYVQTQQRFRNRFPGVRVPAKSSIADMCEKFRHHGTVENRNKTRSGRRKTVRTPANVANVQRVLRQNPRVSARRNPMGMAKSSFNRATHDLGYHPYRIQQRHGLQAGDHQRRMNFCQWLVQRPRRMNLDSCIVDEANFSMNGCVSSQNVRWYAQRQNPPRHFTYDRPNDRRKVMVFAGMVGNNTLIGPVFVNGNMNGQRYLDIINTHVAPTLRRINGVQNNGAIRRFWFFQDGATPHRTVRVRDRLQTLFPNRVVGLGHGVEWPPRSPDLSPLDFCLWGEVKSRVYNNGPPQTIQQLRNRITEAFRAIKRTRIVRRAVAAMRRRAQTCIRLGGQQVEGRAAH